MSVLQVGAEVPVNEHGILVNLETVFATVNLPIPTNVSGVKRLVGMSS